MPNSTKISEIFESLQGEGPYLGVKQLFVRFSKCNLHCSFCDTDFTSSLIEFTDEDFIKEVNSHNNIHSVSLTGGEPLCESDFLVNVLPNINHKVYLETNGTMYKELLDIIPYIDIISMDIKLPSSSKNNDMFREHERFIDTAIDCNKEIFIKVVFDENITDEEINKTINLAEKGDILLVLQPKMDGNDLKLGSDFIYDVYNKFSIKYSNVRLIPQMHKFLNLK